MENGGNQKVNAIFEAHLNVPKPTNSASGPVRERFIRDKYERRKFYDPNAFARVSQLDSQREEEEVVNGVQRRMANRAPSDAARKRVEERATRNGSSTRMTKVPTMPASSPPPAPVVVDLLDFGDFDSPEAASSVHASVVTSTTIGVVHSTPVPSANTEIAEFDIFTSMSIGNNTNPMSHEGIVSNGGQIMPPQPIQPPPMTEPKKMTTDDILSMFNTPSTPQTNMMFSMSGNNSMGMMNNSMAPLQQPMGMMTNLNHPQPMGMMINNLNPQQHIAMMNNMQMQQMMGHQGMNNMGGNMNMGMIGGQSVGSSMGGSNNNNMNMMMQQQDQRPQMNNNMMMMQGGGGGMMHGGNHFVQPMQHQQGQPSPQIQQRSGAHLNQFAEFGNFAR